MVRSIHAYYRGTRHDPRSASVHVVCSIIFRVRHLAVWDVRHLYAHMLVLHGQVKIEVRLETRCMTRAR
jgi:hypothetical protein